jgi:hypothetical protein
VFEFLKDIFGVPRPVTVVGYEDPEVIVKSESPLDLGVVDVVATIEGVEIKGQIQIVESGLDTCRGLWLAPAEALPLLIEVFTPPELRGSPRFERRLRVRSTSLEEYQGNSLDISSCGMRLTGRGTLQIGEVIPISFELDNARETEISCQAKVCWVAPSSKDGWLAIGLQFVDLDTEHQPASYNLYRDFLETLAGDLQLP